ncbi:MAG TPA: YncE family protein [Candidatus Acidoferrum sp.]|nr:YncE family protein [Candidatus Acidoferrum sp.]
MHRFFRNSALIFSVAAVALTPSALRAGDDGGKFKIAKKLPLEGGGRWDYVTVDSDAHRVYIARATHVTVLDSESGAVVGDIPDTPGVHGVAVAPDLGIGFISEGGAAKVAVFDLKSLKVESTIATGENPDSILYHAATHQVFVQNGKSKSTSIIDAKTKKVVATIPFESKPEFYAYDEKGNVFINLEDKHAIAVIDAASKKLKATWVMAGCEGPSGLAIDNKTHTLFSSCDGKLMVVDSNSGKVRQSVAIGDDCDGVTFDPGTGYVFASPSTGKFQIIHADKAGKYSVIQEIDTPVGSKTHGLDPATHKVYLPSAKFTGDPSKRPRPSVVEGSIQVLVVGE